jgi:hypothetical protein
MGAGAAASCSEVLAVVLLAVVLVTGAGATAAFGPRGERSFVGDRARFDLQIALRRVA